MSERDELRHAIKNYMYKYWKIDDEENVERLLAGVMSLIAVEMWDKPFTPMMPPVVIREEIENES